ncbi:hypothetical protein L249_4628, partial [Ophiocordyceps polyrhachis-furcata BCC 54312]
TRPEGLGGSRDAGPAAAGPRPPYVTEAERHNNVGGGYGTATPYSGYGRTGRTGRTKEGTATAAAAAAGLEGLFDYRLLRGGEDEGPALADLATFFFLPTAGELTADSTLFFFDLCGRYGYGYGYGKRPRCYSSSTAFSFPLERSLRPDFFGCFFRPLVFRPFLPSLFFLRSALQPTETTGTGLGSGLGIRVRAGNSSYNSRYNNRNNSSIRTYLRPYRTYAPYSRYLRPQSFVVLFFVVFFFVFSFLRPYPPLRPFQGRGIQQFLDQFEEQVLDRRVDWLPFFVAPPCLRQIQIRTVGFYEKLRRHEARRPKTKDTIDWLEKHAFFCRKVGPGPSPGPDESTEHSYGLFQALPKEIQEGHVTPGRLQPARGRRTSQRLYVTAAHNNVGGGYGYGYGTATPYSGYGRTGRTGRTKEGT